MASNSKSNEKSKSIELLSDVDDDIENSFDYDIKEEHNEVDSEGEEHKKIIISGKNNDAENKEEENDHENNEENEDEDEDENLNVKVDEEKEVEHRPKSKGVHIDDIFDMEDIYDDKVCDLNIYEDSSTPDDTNVTDEIIQAGKLSGLFSEFFETKEVFKPIPITSQLIKSFSSVNYEEISLIVASLGLYARLNLRDNLEESQVNVLDLLNKEENFDIRTIFMGLFSERSILHTLMIRNAIRKKDSADLAKILALKTAEMLKDIRKNYLEIYGTKLENDLLEFPEGPLFVKAVTCKKYYVEVPETAWDAEATRLMGMLKVGNPDPFAIFTMRFSHVSFKGICCTFYNKFGYTFCDYLLQSGINVSSCQVIKIMHDALLSPKSFYCNYLHDMIEARQNTLYFPYLLVYLIGNGLDIIMKQYVELYGNLNITQIANVYEPGIRDLISAILSIFRA